MSQDKDKTKEPTLERTEKPAEKSHSDSEQAKKTSKEIGGGHSF